MSRASSPIECGPQGRLTRRSPTGGDALDVLEAGDEAADELALVVDDGHHRGDELASALAGVFGAGRTRDVAIVTADVAQIVGRGERAGDPLVVGRPCLEPVVGRPD